MTKELTIELTSDCQLHCLWCSSYSKVPYSLNFKDVINHLDIAYNEGFNVVRFSGGEPTLYNKIDDCIKYAKQLGFYVILLTNGLNRYYNINIDKYELQWQPFYIYIIDWYKNMLLNISINVVNVRESDIGNAITFAADKNIPIHIMKLQRCGYAIINESQLHEIDISITGDHGCDRKNKRLIRPDGRVIQCASDKTKEGCKYERCI